MPKKKQPQKLEKYSPEDILAELRVRECGPVMPLKKKIARPRPLAGHDLNSLVKALRNSQKLVYGVDDRQDIFQVTDQAVLARADSTMSLIDIARITDNGDGTSTILTTAFGDAHDLCEGERFRSQPTAVISIIRALSTVASMHRSCRSIRRPSSRQRVSPGRQPSSLSTWSKALPRNGPTSLP